jgi:hypothetical protein
MVNEEFRVYLDRLLWERAVEMAVMVLMDGQSSGPRVLWEIPLLVQRVVTGSTEIADLRATQDTTAP